jgi:hypothetical protein
MGKSWMSSFSKHGRDLLAAIDLDKIYAPTSGYRGEWVADIPPHRFAEVVEWCMATLGPSSYSRKNTRWRAAWVRGDRIFFRYEEDVMLFTLRWV